MTGSGTASLKHKLEQRKRLMSEKNKAILEKGNAAIAEGNNKGFLSLCADDTEWMFVGDKTLKGKEAVRQWMATDIHRSTKVYGR